MSVLDRQSDRQTDIETDLQADRQRMGNLSAGLACLDKIMQKGISIESFGCFEATQMKLGVTKGFNAQRKTDLMTHF